MKFGAVLLAICAFAVSAACAAELPTRSAHPASDSKTKMRTCSIDGQQGFMLPGGATCMLITGSVSAQVSAGSLARQR